MSSRTTVTVIRALQIGQEKIAFYSQKHPRLQYSEEHRAYALHVLRNCSLRKSEDGDVAPDVSKACDILVSEGWHPGSTNRQMFQRFIARESSTSRQRGRPVNHEFEQDIKDQLVVAVYDADEPAHTISVSAAYTRDIVVSTAKKVAKWTQYASDPLVQRLKFKSQWFQGWKARNNLVRRRATTSRMAAPDANTAQSSMHSITDALNEMGFLPSQIVNADETADCYAQNSRYVFLPSGEKRAIIPNLDDSARVTVHVSVCGDGTSLPPFVILKNSVKRADMSRSTVAHSAAMEAHFMQVEQGAPTQMPFTGVWQRDVTVTRLRKPVTEHYKIPYARMADGTIVTANSRAWMNTAFAVMWVDLVLRPAKIQRGGRLALVWDNCGAHTTDAVRSELLDAGIHVFMLPPNTTDRFQVCDVVVNGMLKSALRGIRANILLKDFSQWREEYQAQHQKYQEAFSKLSSAEVAAKTVPAVPKPAPWCPPSLSVAEGLNTMMQALQLLQQDDKQQALRRTFINLGLSPTEQGIWYRVTKSGKRGAEASSADGDRISAQDLLDIPVMSTLHNQWTSEESEDEAAANLRLEGAAGSFGGDYVGLAGAAASLLNAGADKDMTTQ